MKKHISCADLQHREMCCTTKEKAVLLKNEIARFFIDLMSTDKIEMLPYTVNVMGCMFFVNRKKGGCYGRAW